MTNDERADMALAAVMEFRSVCRGSPLDCEDGMAEAIADLLCNLCHLAVIHNLNPLALMETGACNYAAESIEDDGMFLETHATVDVLARKYGSGEPLQSFNDESAAFWRAQAEKEIES